MRRLLRRLAAPALTEAEYGTWVESYRAGRFLESARRASEVPLPDLQRAQRSFLEAGPPPETLAGFRQRLTAALLHADAAAHLGEMAGFQWRLVSRPLSSLEKQWPPGLAPARLEEAEGAWGRRALGDARRLLHREIHLTAARVRLARLDLGGAHLILEAGGPRRDPALAWQAAVLGLARARYLGQDELFEDAGVALRTAVRRRGWTREEAAGSDRATAWAMGTPDDLRLRLALVELGKGNPRAARQSLSRVREPVPDRLLAPLRLLETEAETEPDPGEPPFAGLREATRRFPSSPATVAALVSAMQEAGMTDAAAELANDFLSRRNWVTPWLDFLTTWARTDEPGQVWLRRLVALPSSAPPAGGGRPTPSPGCGVPVGAVVGSASR